MFLIKGSIEHTSLESETDGTAHTQDASYNEQVRLLDRKFLTSSLVKFNFF